MRRSRTTFAFLTLLLSCIASILPGCGGSNAGKVASITVTPSPISVAYGQRDIVLTATAVNSSNATVVTDFAYASNNASAVSIAPDGTICGGTWDATFVNCTKPANPVPQNATISVTAQTVTATVQAYVHEPVDRVLITSSPTTCTSLSLVSSTSQLPQFQATAYSNDSAVCQSRFNTTAPCDITADLTAATAGTGGAVDHSLPFQWSSSDATVATISTPGTTISNSGTSTSTTATLPAGTVTPVGPGQASIIASTAGINSPAVPFVTCPVTSITLTATSASNGGLGQLPITRGGTQTLTAAVTDSAGKTITYPSVTSASLAINYPALSWLSSDLHAASVAAQTQTVNTAINGVNTSQVVPLSSATATGSTSGVASLVASCTPPTCNKNLFPVYSNPIVTINSSNAGSIFATAYVASTQSKVMLAVDVAQGTLIATYGLPSAPNSFLFNRQGTSAVLGSSNGVFVFNPLATTTSTTSTVSPFTTLPFNGKVLSISPDGSLAAVFGQASGSTQNSIGIINLSQTTPTLTTFAMAGTANAADFSIDSRYLWVAVTPSVGSTAGNRVYVFTLGTASTPFGSTFFKVNSPVNDLAFLASGPLVYLAGDTSTASITARATCDGGQQNATSVSVATTGPDLLNGVVDVQPGSAPTSIRALPNGAGVLALDVPNIDVVTLANPEVPSVGCPPALSGSPIESVAPQNLNQGSPTVNQFMVTPDSNTAVLTSTGNSVVLVNLANLQALKTTPIALQNSAVLQATDPATNLPFFFTGGVTGDSTAFVVGGSDDSLHEISISAGTDFALSLKGAGLTKTTDGTDASPNLVGVRNR